MYKFVFIDDEDFIRELFVEILDFQDYGFHLEAVFSTAEEAAKYMGVHSDISAVITDIRMGMQSGIELCEKLREQNPELLLVVMSGYKEFEYAQRAIRCDVFEYLLKPTSYSDLDSLFRRMKEYLDGKHAKDALESAVEYNDLIGTIKGYIKENYAQNISLESVAAEIGMNAAYLSRFFKKHTDMNFLEYLTKIRMRAAKGLLADPKRKIYEVCTMVGYTSLQHFLKLFKQCTGQTPSEYRKKMNENKE